MTTTKTLMLAALAAMSLGVGTAVAQEGGGPSMIPANDYWTLQQRALYAHQTPAVSPQVQSGSSDASTSMHSGTGRGAPVHFDYGTLANPG
jgi:hypothetical protein